MTCKHSFSPDELLDNSEENHPLRKMMVSEMSVQKCNREKVHKFDYCIFHLPIEKRRLVGISKEKTQERVIEEIKEGSRNNFNLYGGNIEGLRITPQDLDTDTVGVITLIGVSISEEVIFRNKNTKGIRAICTEFEKKVELKRMNFTGDCSFRYSEFKSVFSAPKSEFQQSGDFLQAEFNDEFRCGSTFYESANFKGASFGNRTQFRGITVHSNFNLTNIHLKNRIDLVWCDCKGSLELLPRSESDQLLINLSSANISGGKIAITDDTYYNLNNCTIGNVGFLQESEWFPIKEDDENDIVHSDNKIFHHLLIRNTKFDGFEFQKYIHHLEAVDWEIHKTEINVDEFELPMYYSYETDDGFVDVKNLSPITADQLESTYLRAKRGAIQVSEQKSAAEFFIKEMKYRRLRHSQEIKKADTIVRKANRIRKWLSNFAFEIIAGYGERPIRVALSYIVVAFVLIPNLEPYFGSLPIVRDITRTFFVAVLVFTLTRSVER